MGIRNPDVVARSVQRLPMYCGLDTVKIDTTGKTVEDICKELRAVGANHDLPAGCERS